MLARARADGLGEKRDADAHERRHGPFRQLVLALLAAGGLFGPQLRKGRLRLAETAATPMEATWYITCLMRAPHGGVPPLAFRPPVYVTIWS
jgi:hypothetical protein